MNNVTIGGTIPPSSIHLPSSPPQFAYYETIAGGAGASPSRDGLDAVHTHMTNTLNTPVEALEMTYPFRVAEYDVRRGSGGPGLHPGGDGITRTYEFLAEATVTLLTERRRLAPWGLNGSRSGTPGRPSHHRDAGRRRLGQPLICVQSVPICGPPPERSAIAPTT